MLHMQILLLLMQWTVHYTTQTGNFRILWCSILVIQKFMAVSQEDSKGNGMWGFRQDSSSPQSVEGELTLKRFSKS